MKHLDAGISIIIVLILMLSVEFVFFHNDYSNKRFNDSIEAINGY